jgi:hypothetical protein
MLKILFNYLKKNSTPCGGGLNLSILALQAVKGNEDGAQCSKLHLARSATKRPQVHRLGSWTKG